MFNLNGFIDVSDGRPGMLVPLLSSPDTNLPYVQEMDEFLRNILKLIEGSDEPEDARAMQILLQSIKTLAEKGLGRSI
jgi:hypothetical protein